MKTEILQDLFWKELHDLYGSEKLLVRWLPKLMETADSIELRQALGYRVSETRGHVSRLEKIFRIHGEKPSGKNSKALEGILREAGENMADSGNAAIRDTAIVAAVQQIEHYKIAAYGTLQAYATHLGRTEAGKLLQASLQDGRAADRKLSEVTLSYFRREAARIA